MPWSGTSPNKTFSRTTGLQSGSTAWADTENASRGIESSDHDTHDQDLATGINTALAKDGGNSPSANIDWGGYKITNLGAPSSADDAATKEYVDDTATGFVNATVRGATTANIDLSGDLENGDTLDGLTLATSDRILVKDQSTASQNGVYVVVASGAASRATDFDTWDEHVGAIVNVTAGTANAGKSFRSIINSGGTLNTTDIDFLEFGTNLTLPVSVANGGHGQTTAAAGFAALKQNATTSATGVLEIATAAEIMAGTSGTLAIAPEYAVSAAAEVSVSDGATITIDFSAGFNFAVGTLGGNRTLAASNYSGLIGRSGYIKFVQDGTGSRTVDSSASPFVNAGGVDIVLSTAASAVDFVFYQIVSISSAAKIILSVTKAVG